jgi:hypothetical protein
VSDYFFPHLIVNLALINLLLDTQTKRAAISTWVRPTNSLRGLHGLPILPLRNKPLAISILSLRYHIIHRALSTTDCGADGLIAFRLAFNLCLIRIHPGQIRLSSTHLLQV